MPLHIKELLEASFDSHGVPDAVHGFIRHILGNRQPLGVLYYGSSLWKQDLTGLLDFYIICDDLTDWNGKSLTSLANYCLPPNIEYYEFTEGQTRLRAKVAILSLKQLQRAVSVSSWDTTLWARFCQPVKILWWREEKARKSLSDCLVQAVKTAVWWATCLGPKEGTAESYWIALFSATYQAELRVEAVNRPSLILENREAYFTSLLKAAWQAMDIHVSEERQGVISPHISSQIRKHAEKQWRLRSKVGRPLNILRLIKAAFTFKGGADYIAWKIKRHRSIDLRLTAFQKRHPLISAPWILLKLYRQGVFKR